MMITVPTAIPVWRLIPLCSTSHGEADVSGNDQGDPDPQMISPTTHWAIRQVSDDGIARRTARRDLALRSPATAWGALLTYWRQVGGPPRRTRRTGLLGRVARRCVLGMPLHSDNPAIGKLDTFDDVICPRRDDEPGPEPIDCLVVDAVRPRAGRPIACAAFDSATSSMSS